MVNRYEIYGINGQKVISIDAKENESDSYQIDISRLDPGVYFIKALSTGGNEVLNSKFIKVN